MVTNDYRCSPKGSVRLVVAKKPRFALKMGENAGLPGSRTLERTPGTAFTMEFLRNLGTLSLFPALSCSRQEFLLVRSHQLYQRLIPGLLVRCGPENHLGENRRKIDAFPG